MNRLCALIALSVLGAMLCGLVLGPKQSALVQDEARFGWVDIHLDAGAGTELGAWQIELVDATGRSTIVGIEGGEHPAFAEPPHYDPRAMADSDRVVLAAFSTADVLPTGRTRVARIHVRTTGKADWKLTLIAAADAAGTPIEPETKLEEGSAP